MMTFLLQHHALCHTRPPQVQQQQHPSSQALAALEQQQEAAAQLDLHLDCPRKQ
jgi:hypothetical protein